MMSIKHIGFGCLVFLMGVVNTVIAKEVKLKNGSIFSGNVISQTEKVLVLEVNGSKVNIFKNIVQSIDGVPYTDQNAGVQQTAESAPGQVQGPIPIQATNVQKETPAVASSSSIQNNQTVQQQNVAPISKSRVRVVTFNGDDEQETFQVNSTEQKKIPGESIQIGKETHAQMQIEKAEPVNTIVGSKKENQLNIPASRSAQKPDTIKSVSSIPQATPVNETWKIAPEIISQPTVVQQPVVLPVKRTDGKTEITLRNGTVFIGKILSQNERFISFFCDGATLNILRRLIKTLDGVSVDSVAIDMSGKSRDSLMEAQKQTSLQTGEPKNGPGSAVKIGDVNVKALRVTFKVGASVQELIDSLKSGIWQHRSNSAAQIGSMGQWASNATENLGMLLSDTGGSGSSFDLAADTLKEFLLPPGKESARALGALGVTGFEHLTNALRTGNAVAKKNAAYGLGQTKEARAIDPLTSALANADISLKVAIVKALRFEGATQTLVNLLNDNDPDVRAASCNVLGQIRSQSAAKSLVNALYDKHARVRAASAEALGKIGGTIALTPLTTALQDGNMFVRINAAKALGETRDTAAVWPLIGSLKDENSDVRSASAQSLSRIRDPRAIPSLYSLLKDDDVGVRAESEKSIRLHTEIPLLIEALAEPFQSVRENVAYVLWLMTGKDFGQDKSKWNSWYEQEQNQKVKNVSQTTDTKQDSKIIEVKKVEKK